MKKLTLLSLMFSFILFATCKKHDYNRIDHKRNGDLYTVSFNGQNVQVLKKGNFYYFYDDVVFDQKTFDSLQSLYLKKTTTPRSVYNPTTHNHWTNGIVYYTISTAFDTYPAEKQKIISALDHYRNNTGLQFVPRTNQYNFVTFERENYSGSGYGGASNFIGMKGGPQSISLYGAFDTGLVIHEIGHTIGLYHEQSRSDRDQHIVVNWQNMLQTNDVFYQFKTYGERNQPGAEFGPFDWNSIMLYDSYNSSRFTPFTPDWWNNPVMVRQVDTQPFFTNTTGLSTGDVNTVNLFYNRIPKIVRRGNSYSANGGWVRSVYVDFFTDASLTTPKVLTSPQILHIETEGISVANCSLAQVGGLQSIWLEPGQSSYYIGEEHHWLECYSMPEDDYLYINAVW